MFTRKIFLHLAAFIFAGLYSVTGISARAASATIVIGQPFTLTPAVDGTAPFAYQWYKDGVAMSGATAASYQVAATQAANVGVYSVMISNSAGSTTSDNATITLASSPVITTQPASQSVTAGNVVTFTAAASGLPAPTFQWKLNGASIAGATNTSLTLSNVQSANAGTYTVVATNIAGSVTSTGATLTVNVATSAPVFTTQPVSQTVIAGSAVTFTAAASGVPIPTFQWRKNGTAISGATGSSYTIASATSADASTYTVVASNSAGSVTSNSAVLTVNSAPAFSTQPISQTVTAGASVSFTVVATGSPAPTFQWKLNGANVSGATNATLAITNAQSANAGTYTAVATNSVGSATSTGATLTVNPITVAPAFTAQPISQTVTAGSSVTFTAAATGSPAPTFQWKLNGANITGATSATLTIANAQSANAGTYTVVAANSAGSATSVGATLTVNPLTSAPVFTTQPASQSVTTGSSVTFTAVASGSPTPTYQWQKNGAAISGATGASYVITSATFPDASTYTVVATNSVGSVTSNGAVLTVNGAPVITTQPTNQVATTGGSASFTVVASGSATLSYQWRRNGTKINRATSATYTNTNVSSGSAGTYTVVVSNSYGSVTSAGATLTVNPASSAPAFTTQPASQTVTAGGAVSFAALASGSPTPTYQWQKNGVAISGATGTSYSIASAASTDAGAFSVVATNSAGSVTSNSAILTVNTAPVITTQPVSQTVTAGNSVTFSTAASGSPAPTFQWRLNGANLSGATSATLALTNVQSANAGTYTVVATNSVGSATSLGATLAVNAATAAPTFTTQPTSQTVTAGSAVTFTALASGSPAPTYQWQKNGGNISGATGTSYTIANATSTDAGNYSVVALNSAGSATSGSAVLTVNTAPIITTQPSSQTGIVGASVTFSVAASGTPVPSYQWYRDGAAISGATAATYTIAALASIDAGSYTAKATNSVGSVTSSPAVLTVNSVPVFTTQPVSQSVASGASVTFTANATGAPAPAYQWRKNGTAITGATAGTYTIASVAPGDAGTYSVVATNSTGSATSNSATLAVTVPASPIVTRIDFNGDGNCDILFQNIATGDWKVWLMSGTAGYSMITLSQESLQTRICGAGDFNGDGKSDIIWQNSTTGECGVWLMNGTTVSSKVSLGILPLAQQLRAAGDFNGDGKSDLVWQNVSTGECSVWLMNGTTVMSNVSLGVASTNLMLTATGDFNRDGQSDILWQDSVTGAYGVWLMAGTTISSNVSIGTMTLDWQMSGAGDFNGDGNSDILWQNLLTGEGRMWLMNGTTLTSDLHLFTVTTNLVMRN